MADQQANNQQPNNQETISLIKKKELTIQEEKNNIKWLFNQLTNYPVFKGCTPYSYVPDDYLAGYLYIDNREQVLLTERLANIFRPDIDGRISISIVPDWYSLSVSISTLHPNAVKDIYKWAKRNGKALKIEKIEVISLLERKEEPDDDPYIHAISIDFHLDTRDSTTFETREKSIHEAINTMLTIAEKSINEDGNRVVFNFNEQNLPEIRSMMKNWLKKKSFKRSKFDENIETADTYYIASAGGRGKGGDFSRRMNKIINGKGYSFVTSSLSFYYLGLLSFHMDVDDKYRKHLPNIYSWLENNKEELGLSVPKEGKESRGKELSICFVNIDTTNYKERLEVAFNTIDKAIKMFK